MPLEFITHNGKKYPKWESEGNAARWILPLAKHILDPERNVGYDIGYSKESWMLPGAVGIEPSIDPNWDAMRLPNDIVDFIFSSHMLEHIKGNIYECFDYWLSKIKVGGIMFLYLPHSSQSYWHPSSNRKHVHKLDESEIETYLNDLGHKVYVSGVDWNHSFVVICEKIDASGNALRRCADAILKLQADEKEASLKEPHIITPLSIKNFDFTNANRKSNGFEPLSFDEYNKRGGMTDIPTGHYPVKDSLLYNFPKKEILKPLIEYDAGDRITETEYLLLKEKPYYNDRILFEEDTWPSDNERYYTIKLIKR